MAALAASRGTSRFAKTYQSLRAAGKPAKLALMPGSALQAAPE
jgi:hypothetical protein